MEQNKRFKSPYEHAIPRRVRRHPQILNAMKTLKKLEEKIGRTHFIQYKHNNKRGPGTFPIDVIERTWRLDKLTIVLKFELCYGWYEDDTKVVYELSLSDSHVGDVCIKFAHLSELEDVDLEAVVWRWNIYKQTIKRELKEGIRIDPLEALDRVSLEDLVNQTKSESLSNEEFITRRQKLADMAGIKIPDRKTLEEMYNNVNDSRAAIKWLI